MKNSEREMVCVIILRGNSADDAFAAGQEDLENFILPEKIGVKPDEVEVRFVEYDEEHSTINLNEEDAKAKRETKRIVEDKKDRLKY